MRHALVTGGAGFVGSHLVDRLLAEGWKVSVVDDLDRFYDPLRKERNIAPHRDYAGYTLHRIDIRDAEALRTHLTGDYDVVVHLAARVGVRPSLEEAQTYQEVNVGGTQNLLELCKAWGTEQFIFASSSSVYGVNPNVPWREDDHVLMPISPYAATKVSGELLGHVYSHLYGIRFVALRFFTVYGPRQRPDLAIHKFACRMLGKEPIPIYGDGATRRDYTYVLDIVQGIRAAMDYHDSSYQILNLGNNHTVSLKEMVHTLEEVLGVEAKLQLMPEQPGDVPRTWADISLARERLGYRPETDFRTGIEQFGAWLRASI